MHMHMANSMPNPMPMLHAFDDEVLAVVLAVVVEMVVVAQQPAEQQRQASTCDYCWRYRS